ncbi:PEP-CTERM sorting domain-containing protein [Aeoliella sp.]|uniref:PEP-CTERM sorting domain-containing protein n=1 Tax=Aeoliella sp. TaxID=2795800 RepID=UPI003CCBB7FC
MAKSTSQTANDRSTSRRRLAYALAAGSAATVATDADAVVVYSGIEDFVIDQGNQLPLKMNADDVPDIYLNNYIDPYEGLVGNFQGAFLGWAPGRLVGKRANNLGYVRALETGFMVDGSSINPNVFVGSMAHEDNHPNAEFNNVQNAYIGFSFPNIPSFPPPAIPDRELHYAWVRVSVDNLAGTFVVHDWAYESEPDVGITTGDKGDAGDFNDDGVVNIADYVVWRNNLGSNHILGGHGDENGDSFDVVDEDDYTIWKANFGHVSSEAAAATSPIPEPGALGLLAAGSLGLGVLRRRNLR